MADNQFLLGLLKGAYEGGIGNPEVNDRRRRYALEEAYTKGQMAEDGLETKTQVPQDKMGKILAGVRSTLFPGLGDSFSVEQGQPAAYVGSDGGVSSTPIEGGLGLSRKEAKSAYLARGKQSSYVIPNLDANGNVIGFTNLPPGSKPAGGFAKPPAPQAGLGENGMRLPPASVLQMNEGQSVARMLPDVEKALVNNINLFGPIAGRAGSANPYNTQSQTVDARMRTASQAFGRFMEGGVLRKEDEEKYRKMFPQLSDTPDVAKNKLSIVTRQLAEKYQSDRESLRNSKYDVSGLSELEIPSSIFDRESNVSSDDQQALEWAESNPLDPRAIQIKKRLGR